jgi:hypothetical protein
MAVERLNSAARIFVVIHFDEAKAARLSGKTVPHQRHIRRRNTGFRKPVRHIFFTSLKRQIAHVQFFQVILLVPVMTQIPGSPAEERADSVGSPNHTRLLSVRVALQLSAHHPAKLPLRQSKENCSRVNT